MYLFDTDILSQTLKPSPAPQLIARLAELAAERQFTSAVTVGEMVYGAHRSARRDVLLRRLEERVWPNVRILPFDRAAGETYGRLRAELEFAGTLLSEPDLRIAAIALTHNLTLVTGNVRHFSRVSGLRVEDWINDRT
jgi:tRNA(fMet)-specific endonuclease VapC